jgi:hypothetical protein
MSNKITATGNSMRERANFIDVAELGLGIVFLSLSFSLSSFLSFFFNLYCMSNKITTTGNSMRERATVIDVAVFLSAYGSRK